MPAPPVSKPSHLSLPERGPAVTRARVDSVASTYGPQLRDAELDDLGPTEAWTVEGSNRANGYATHGLFRYFGKYPPPIGRELIQDHSAPGDLVLDPTGGSGTTGVEALLAGRRCRLFDVSPTALAVARAKTTPVCGDAAREALAQVVERYTPATATEYPLEPVGLRNPDHWFLPETADSLRGLHRSLHTLDDTPVRQLLHAAYLGAIRRCSRATTQQGRLFLDADTARTDTLDTFVRFSNRAIKGASALPTNGDVTVCAHDARQPLPLANGEQADFVFTHPPYFNAYKYSRINSLELAWTGVKPADVRRSEIREYFKIGKPENAAKYVNDMQGVVENCLDAVRPGGAVAVMIGDTRLQGTHIPVTRRIIDQVRETRRMEVEKVVLRIPRHTEASWVSSQRRTADKLGVPLCDYIVVLRAPQ